MVDNQHKLCDVSSSVMNTLFLGDEGGLPRWSTGCSSVRSNAFSRGISLCMKISLIQLQNELNVTAWSIGDQTGMFLRMILHFHSNERSFNNRWSFLLFTYNPPLQHIYVNNKIIICKSYMYLFYLHIGNKILYLRCRLTCKNKHI